MLTVIVAAAALQAKTYEPHGPQIRFTMWDDKSFVITTDPDHSPKTVAHILSLVRHHFYDRLRVHRVEWWVTQWGDPLSRRGDMKDKKMGDGGSGPAPDFKSRNLPFEQCDVDFVRGIVGVASDGFQMGGDSQLFVLKQDAWRLYHSYAVVGKVTEGMDAVGEVEKGDRIKNARIVR